MTDEQHKYPFAEFDPLKLEIVPELVGASLECEIGGYNLQFQLPTPSDPKLLTPKRASDNSWTKDSDDNFQIRSIRSQVDTIVPVALSVKRVKLVFLESSEFEHYKVEADNNSYSLAANPHNLAADLIDIGKVAMNTWFRVLR